MHVLYLFALFSNVLFCFCQYSTIVVNVVEITSNSSYTFVCDVSSSTNLTRWTYLSGPTGASLMSYQNGRCLVSPSGSFLSNSAMYSYACSSTVYQVTIFQSITTGNINNNVLACRDAEQPEEIGSNWMIEIVPSTPCTYCRPPITFHVIEVTEVYNVTFICRVSSDVTYVNWKKFASNTAAMGVDQNGQCTTQGTTFLDDRSKYIYTCNKTVYQVTIINVQRSEHNGIYMCTPPSQQEGTGSNWIIKVKAPVTYIAMKPANYLVNVKENTAVEFTCTTSTARPAASVYWYRHPNGNDYDVSQITNNITTTTDYNDLSITTSILRFVPTRQDNDTKIYCRANNSVNTFPVRSNNKRFLNVLFKAEDPYIHPDNECRVIENTPVTLSCSVKGGNPTPILSWSCNNFSPFNQTSVNSNGNVTTTFTLNVLRSHDGTCTCTSLQTGFQDTTTIISLVVLYPPSKPEFKVSGTSVDGDISFKESNTRSIKCTTDSKPSPDRYTWTGPIITDTVNIQTLTFITVKKEHAGQYKCSVRNTMNPSDGGVVAGINSRTVNVVVLYPPSALYFVYDNQRGQNIFNKVIDVIQGDTFNIVCKSMDGNPSPTIKWNGQNDYGSVLTVINIQESRTNATCTATNNMKETNRPVVKGYISDTIKFDILVRPTIKGCDFFYTNRQYTVFNLRNDNADRLMVMENESFILNCSAEGKPSPTVLWKIPDRSLVSSSSVIVKNLTRHMGGDYVFTSNSLLKPSFKGIQNVTVNRTVSVQVLYLPAVQPMNAYSILIGEQLNMMCNYTAGMPKTTSIKWTRDIDNREWNNATLSIDSFEKSDTGIYTCTASNIMKQSGDSKSYIGQHSQSFHLDVQYAATITSFTIGGHTSQSVTLNESDPVRFICNADSNPTAVMTLSDESKTFKSVSSNFIEYKIADARCLDVGTYFCSAQNVHNEENGVQNTVQLFVNCYPRAANVKDVNKPSEKNKTVTIVFNVIAYPPPQFSWYQLVDGNWTPLHDSDHNVIKSTNLQSNLTIHSVGMDDFTSYKVVVENEFGQMEQVYTLSPYDKPNPPTRLRHVEDRTTTSSIHIEWEPGFDNGPSQTFYIKYKKSSDTVWNYLSVSDTGESTMNITLTGLLENTQYDVIIFASNVKGNSSESDVLIIRTTAIPPQPTTPGALIGGIISGVTGCVIIVVIIIFIIRKYSLFEVCSKSLAHRKCDETNHSAEEHAYYNVGSDTIETKTLADETAYYNVSSVPEYETISQNNVESSPYSTLDPTELRTTSDDFSEEKMAVYENLKLEVF